MSGTWGCLAQGPECNPSSGLEFSVKAHWEFLSVLVLLFVLGWFGFWICGEAEQDTRRERMSKVCPRPCAHRHLWVMKLKDVQHIYLLKHLVFYEFSGTDSFLWCSNPTQALGVVRGVGWLCCCSSLLSALCWECFWRAVNLLQMHFQTQFPVLFADHKPERNWPA